MTDSSHDILRAGLDADPTRLGDVIMPRAVVRRLLDEYDEARGRRTEGGPVDGRRVPTAPRPTDAPTTWPEPGTEAALALTVGDRAAMGISHATQGSDGRGWRTALQWRSRHGQAGAIGDDDSREGSLLAAYAALYAQTRPAALPGEDDERTTQ